MAEMELERVELSVPINTGALIGNTLRQFAMRGTSTWQVAAYKVGTKEGSFGLSGGFDFSYLELLPGKVLSETVDMGITEKLCKFELRDGEYWCDDICIGNLPNMGVSNFQACLVYASGARSAEQNYAVVKRLCPTDVNDYVAVPSKHTKAIEFRYSVKPLSLSEETLIVEATAGSIAMARDVAVKSLSGLHI